MNGDLKGWWCEYRKR